MCKSLPSGDAASISRPLTNHCLIRVLHSAGSKPPNASWRLHTSASLSQGFSVLGTYPPPPPAYMHPREKIGATRKGPQTSPRRTTGPPTKRPLRAGLASPATSVAPSWPASGGGGSGGSTSRARSGAGRSARGGGAGSASGAGSAGSGAGFIVPLRRNFAIRPSGIAAAGMSMQLEQANLHVHLALVGHAPHRNRIPESGKWGLVSRH